MLILTAPRINKTNGYYYRHLKLDEELFAKSNRVIATAVRGGQYKTRKELATLLETHNMGGSPQRLALIVMRAELDAIICSGPMRGKQFTYALLDERAVQAAPLTTKEALSRLAERYFRSHGPASLKDFVWWSGLSIQDARTGLELAKLNLQKEIVDGTTYWLDPLSMKAVVPIAERVFLLQNYDEYVVSYIDRSFLVNGTHLLQLGDRTNPLFYNCVIYGGYVIGVWKRTIRLKEVVISWKLFNPTKDQQDTLAEAFKRYESFLNLPIRYDNNGYTALTQP
jgi:Winged helix DNA-binding domain